MTDKRVFKAQEIDSYISGWVVDLSGPGPVNPDAYWYFSSKRKATAFVKQIDSGVSPRTAARFVETTL